MRDTDEFQRGDQQDTFLRIRSWLGSRPMESWGFFAAGFVIARALF